MSSTSLTPEPTALTHASWLSLEIVKPANSPHRLFPEVLLTPEWAAKDGKRRHCGTIKCRLATISGALVVNSMLKMVTCLGGILPDSHGRTGHGVYLNDPIMGVYDDPGFRNPGVKDLNPCKKCLPVVGALDIRYHDSNGGRSSPTHSDGIDDEGMMEVDG